MNTACKRAVFFYFDSGDDFYGGSFVISKTNGNAVLKTDILIQTIDDIEERGHVSLER
jgi:hypothetical protein